MIPYSGNHKVPIFPLVVYGLIALNVYVFAQELATPDRDAFFGAFAAIPYDITHNIVLAPPSPPFPALTILTSMFVHGSLLHIVFNMLFLFVFGPDIEYLCGHVRFLLLYLVCGIAAALAEAGRAGYRVAILHSSAMGLNVYRRLGFAPICITGSSLWSAE